MTGQLRRGHARYSAQSTKIVPLLGSTEGAGFGSALTEVLARARAINGMKDNFISGASIRKFLAEVVPV